MAERCRARLYSAFSWTRLATLCVLLLSVCVKVRAEDGCLHKYTEHLNHFPICSPYENGIMRLECTVEVPLNATNITVGWFLDCQQLTNDSHVTISSQVQDATEVHRVRSRLVINYITDDFAGEYTCNILGDEEYVPSDPFRLRDTEYLDEVSALGPCPEGGDVFSNAEEAPDKCAEITEDNPIPMSLVCEAPPATSSQSLPTTTSTPVILSTSSPSPSSSPHHPTGTPTPSNPPKSVPTPTERTEEATSSTGPDPTSIWLYVVVAVAAVFFMIIVVLVIVCVGMCVRRTKTMDEQVLNGQIAGKHIASMQPNQGYEGEFYPDSGPSPQPPLPPVHPSLPSPYNTMDTADYEVVGPGNSNYQHLERPTLTAGMMTRFSSTPDTFSPSTTMTSVYPVSATPTKHNGTPMIGGLPPPLPSTVRPGGGAKLLHSPESLATFDSAFHAGSVDLSSPPERDRIDSTSMLLPKERKGSPTTIGTGEFEGLYTPRGQWHSPTSPLVTTHPLQKIPETGASFPEPSNPHPFPISTSTYESIPGDDSLSGTAGVAGYERPLPSPKNSGHLRSVTLPVHTSPPPSEDRGREEPMAAIHHNSLGEASNGRAVTLSPHRQQELELNVISGPIYHSLEQSNDVRSPRHISNGLLPPQPPTGPVVETADFSLDSESGGANTLTPGFPVVSADFADTPTRAGSFPVSKVRPQRRQVTNELSSDFTGDSDYPQFDDTLTDCTGGSSTTAYPESEWTAGTSATGGNGTLAGDSTVFRFNGRSSSHTGSSCSTGTLTPSLDSGTVSHRPSSSEGSSSHPPSCDGTANRSLTNGKALNVLPLNGMTLPNDHIVPNGAPLNVSVPNSSCSVKVQFTRVPAGSSHTVPATGGGCGIIGGGGGGQSSHTISAPRNHYKKLDPSTMDPNLKYTRLNVGKLTAV